MACGINCHQAFIEIFQPLMNLESYKFDQKTCKLLLIFLWIKNINFYLTQIGQGQFYYLEKKITPVTKCLLKSLGNKLYYIDLFMNRVAPSHQYIAFQHYRLQQHSSKCSQLHVFSLLCYEYCCGHYNTYLSHEWGIYLVRLRITIDSNVTIICPIVEWT